MINPFVKKSQILFSWSEFYKKNSVLKLPEKEAQLNNLMNKHNSLLKKRKLEEAKEVEGEILKGIKNLKEEIACTNYINWLNVQCEIVKMRPEIVKNLNFKK
jgi:hypothetical protein